ncbi:hypothetical protein XTPLMG730_0180 [Xanthomonas translucens pv. phlei]|uniref:Uncharacterized protein n=1 Tax=Xanthomonas graminis pv. phlei TaxID=487906 RepID=A0A0K2ZDB9_9XANT|nr:hypothetical protein XTPLMG730_0180 [Xanthomonas translucens pv. phlei]
MESKGAIGLRARWDNTLMELTQRSLVLFDFDHTITTTDTYARFLRRVATPQQLARAKWSVGPQGRSPRRPGRMRTRCYRRCCGRR